MPPKNVLRRKAAFVSSKAEGSSEETDYSLTSLLRPASAEFSDTSSNEVVSRDMSQPVTPRTASPARDADDTMATSTTDVTPTQAAIVPAVNIRPAAPEEPYQRPYLDADASLDYCVMEFQIAASASRASIRKTFNGARKCYEDAAVEVERQMADHSTPAVLGPLHEKLATIQSDLDKAIREAEQRVHAIMMSATRPIQEAHAANMGRGANGGASDEENDSDLELDKQLRAHAQPRTASKAAASDEEPLLGKNGEASSPQKGKDKKGKKGKKSSKLTRML